MSLASPRLTLRDLALFGARSFSREHESDKLLGAGVALGCLGVISRLKVDIIEAPA